MTGYLQQVRTAHKGYRRYGNRSDAASSAFLADRARTRDDAVFAIHCHLCDHGSRLLGALPAKPERNVWRTHRNGLRSAWVGDKRLSRDLRKVRYNGGEPISVVVLEHWVTHAARDFRAAIDLTAGMSRQSKDKARAKAWREFDAVLAAVALLGLARSHPREVAIAQVASGALN